MLSLYREDPSLTRDNCDLGVMILLLTYNTVPTRRTVVYADDFSLLVDYREIPVRSEYPEVERATVEESGPPKSQRVARIPGRHASSTFGGHGSGHSCITAFPSSHRLFNVCRCPES